MIKMKLKMIKFKLGDVEIRSIVCSRSEIEREVGKGFRGM